MAKQEKKDIILMVDAVANQKGMDKELVFQALESAFAMVGKKRHGLEFEIRVAIDRDSGDFELFRQWHVFEKEDEIEIPDCQFTLEQAKERDPEAQVGSIIEEKMEDMEFGRIGATQAKQYFVQEVQKIERKLMVEEYSTRVGELVSGTVKKTTRDSIFIDLGGSGEGVIPRTELLPREIMRPGDRVRGYLYEVSSDLKGSQILISRTRPEMLIELFKIEVPEIGDGVIEVKSAARDPGSRAKIAVKTNDGRIDPIGACVGMRGSRVQAVSSELGGERIDIVLWDDNPAQLVLNTMAPAEIASIMVDEESHSMDIAVEEEHLPQAIGRSGQNVRLASILTGWTLNVMSKDDAEQKSETESKDLLSLFKEKLDVEEDVAAVLIEEGFSSLDEVAYVDEAEMLKIDGFDEEIVTELRTRARDVLLTKAIADEEQIASEGPKKDLLDLEGMERELAFALSKKGVKTREDLAELAVDDLLEIVEEMNEEQAAKLIMNARAHWFEETE